MSAVYRITGKDSTDDTPYATLDDARAALHASLHGKRGDWVEDTDAKGDFRVTFTGKLGRRSWVIKKFEVRG